MPEKYSLHRSKINFFLADCKDVFFAFQIFRCNIGTSRAERIKYFQCAYQTSVQYLHPIQAVFKATCNAFVRVLSQKSLPTSLLQCVELAPKLISSSQTSKTCSSHSIHSITIMELAEQNQIIFLCLPSHSIQYRHLIDCAFAEQYLVDL